ncbi:hypothetical protein Taro_035431 [Colocasia esculenta]|uniref:Uncharacterized protein n=1 Tax=Colocasia esculenta TaxID=4460 RepID=A0A843WAH5_COLES|nr:hypothetical protein [Colocasia esculenta]
MGRRRPSPSRQGRGRVSCRVMSWRRDQKAALTSVATMAEGAFDPSVVVRCLFRNASSVGCPRFCVSQAPVCARGLSRYSGTVEVLSSSWTPSLSERVVVRLRERQQRTATLVGPYVRDYETERVLAWLTGCGVLWWWHSCVCVSVVVPHGGRPSKHRYFNLPVVDGAFPLVPVSATAFPSRCAIEVGSEGLEKKE